MQNWHFKTPKMCSMTLWSAVCHRLKSSSLFWGLLQLIHKHILTQKIGKYLRFACHCSFRWYQMLWYSMRSASNAPNLALARRYLLCSICKLWMWTSSHNITSAVEPSQPVRAVEVTNKYTILWQVLFSVVHVWMVTKRGESVYVCVINSTNIITKELKARIFHDGRGCWGILC